MRFRVFCVILRRAAKCALNIIHTIFTVWKIKLR
ncbi:MAG: hypothetical protein JWN98_445, partial [Abditibacteriota bacterium]|nr:hypothetical protein [Abditibacteriota bacterium]